MFDDLMQPHPSGFCRWCGVPVYPDSFRNIEPESEYRLGASCQRCQDVMYLGGSDEDPPASHPLRLGVAVGAASAERDLSEVALLPFVFVVATRRLVWEPRLIVRAGFSLPPVDPWVEISPMHNGWKEHTARVLCVPTLYDPRIVGGPAAAELIIGLDASAVRLASRLSADAQPPALVNLAAEVAWQAAYGAPLLPLADFLTAHLPGVKELSPGTRRPSALRQCALAARLLDLPVPTGRDTGLTAFELLLRAHAGRFGESSRGRCRASCRPRRRSSSSGPGAPSSSGPTAVVGPCLACGGSLAPLTGLGPSRPPASACARSGRRP